MSKNIFTKFPRTFWVANLIELFERWAWYGLFMLFANYLTGSSDEGGLEFTSEQKGYILGNGTAILYFLPIITGAIADKYGYKKVLFVAFIIYTSAFLLFPTVKTPDGVFYMYLYLALGAALFKPIISATVSKTTTSETSSLGFGIFYMMVNIGAFFGPLLTLFVKKESYDVVFHVSAFIVAINFIMLIFYKEPGRQPNPDPISRVLKQIFINVGKVIIDWKLMIFFLIIGGFWAMYYQLFFTLPVFIEQWISTAGMFDFFNKNIPFLARNYGSGGSMDAEFVTNFDALFIILLQIPISIWVMKIKPLKTISMGILISSFGMALTLVTQDITFFLIGLLVFGVGEMIGSPKITEYLGLIAPPEKKALYMGFSFAPVFMGSKLAGYISGIGYAKLADKHEFLREYATQNGLKIDSSLPLNQQFMQVANAMNMSSEQLTNTLWATYKPYNIWLLVFGIGIIASLSLFAYNKLLIKKTDSR